jgi:adenylate cyclase
MVFKQRIFRYSLGLLITFVLFANASGLIPLRFVETLENLSYDFRLQISLPDKIDKKVIIIDIDEKSLAEIGQWPWERNVLSTIVDNLFDYYQINVLGFDILFAEKDEDPTDVILTQLAKSPISSSDDFQRIIKNNQNLMNRDKSLAKSLANRNTVMGVIFTHQKKALSKGKLPPSIPQFTKDIIQSFAFLKAAGFTANIKSLQDNAATGGFFDNPLIDEDGVFRRVPLLQSFDDKLYPSLALEITRSALQNNTLKLGYGSSDDIEDNKSLEWVYIGDIAIPVDEHSAVMVPYAGPQRTFDYISATDILNKRIPRNLLQNKIAIFGTSAAGLLDLRTTPLESAYPGVEVHANIIQGILDQSIKHEPEYMIGFEILILFLLGSILTIALPMLSPSWSTITAVLSIGIILLLDQYAWNQLMVIMPIASPLILVVMLYIMNMSYGFFVESRGKRQLTHLFGQYVPPELVDEMSRNLKEINLDGELRNMTVLFTDVRGFTSISENMEPKTLTTYINAFLTPLTEVIHKNRGTIDKYMGDAIMAFWGAPLKDPHHARNALVSGLDMLQAIKKLNKLFESKDLPLIKIGIGVNTGEMNVGNKGSEFRVDYTVLGDSVNLGSRLEGLTKNYGVDFIVSESTRHEVPEFEYRMLDIVKVKGKKKPVTIFEPIDFVENVDRSVRKNIKEFNHALKLYKKQNWDSAEQTIFHLSQQEPTRLIYKIYLDRIAFFRANPPGDDWNGVFTHTSK